MLLCFSLFLSFPYTTKNETRVKLVRWEANVLWAVAPLGQKMLSMWHVESGFFLIIALSFLIFAWYRDFSDMYSELCSCISLPASLCPLLCAVASVYPAGCTPADETDVGAIPEWSGMLHQDLDIPLDIWMLLAWEACLRLGGWRSLVAVNIGSSLLFKWLVHWSSNNAELSLGCVLPRNLGTKG